jgi:hypothetical protein
LKATSSSKPTWRLNTMLVFSTNSFPNPHWRPGISHKSITMVGIMDHWYISRAHGALIATKSPDWTIGTITLAIWMINLMLA